MALLPRLPKINLGAQEVSYTLNTALHTTEGRGLWPATMVPGLAIDTVRTLNTTTGTLTSFAPWPTASVAYNQAQVTALVNHVTPTAPAVNDDSFTYDNGDGGHTYNLDVLANDGSDDNLLNNAAPLLGPDVVITAIDSTDFNLGALSISADGKSINFDLGFLSDTLPYVNEKVAAFTYTVTNLSGFSSTATAYVTVSQNVIVISGQGPLRTDGTNQADTIHGRNDFGELILAGEGNDTVYGNNNYDEIFGEAGNDRLFGGAGGDRLYGGSGDDLLDGGDDEDRLFGSIGNDTLYGGNGNDHLEGGEQNDVLYGGEGNDRLIGTGVDVRDDQEVDYLYGEGGEDHLTGSYGSDFLYGGADDDLLVGGSGNDMLDGGTGSDTIYGGNGNDTIYGDADGTDNIYGEIGDDTIIGNGGYHDIDGGAGNDIITASGRIKGGEGNDIITHDGRGGQLEGGAGDDTIYAYGGSSFVSGGAGFDVIFGGAEGISNTFYFHTGSDIDVVFNFDQGFDKLLFDGAGLIGLTSGSINSFNDLAGDDGIWNDGDSNGTVFVHDNGMMIDGIGFVSGLQIDYLNEASLLLVGITGVTYDDTTSFV